MPPNDEVADLSANVSRPFSCERKPFDPSRRRVFEQRERDPFKIQIRDLPVHLDEIGLRNLLINLDCPKPTAVWIQTRAIEGSPTEALRTYAFVEFASTRDTECAFGKLHRKETQKTRLFCSYATIRKESTLKVRNIEKEFEEFLESYEYPDIPDFPKMVNESVKTLNGSANGSTLLPVVFEEVSGSLVAFLPSRDTDCGYCGENAVRHLHYLASEKTVVDPTIQPPPMEEVSCSSCGSESGLKKCTACKSVYYCSRKCQIKDWTKHSTQCSKESRTPPPSASFPPSANPSANVTPVLTTTVRHVQPKNAELEPIQKPLAAGGDVPDGSPLLFLKKLDERKKSLPINSVNDSKVEDAKRAEEAARAKELERKRKEAEDKKQLVLKMEALKVEREKEAEAAAKLAAAVSGSSDVRVLELGKPIDGMVVWQDEKDNKIYFLSGDEDLIYNTIAPKTEDAVKLADVVPTMGLTCIAKSVDDGVHYRAKITKVLQDTVEVLFIDYGNTNTIPTNGIKPLQGEIAIDKVPAQAVKVMATNGSVDEKLSMAYNDGTAIKITPVSRDGDTYKVEA